MDKNDENEDYYFMKKALEEAQKAYDMDEVPVGCVIVIDGKIIAKAHNERQSKHDVLGHAECVAIKKATRKYKTWVLENATLYVTLEPCLMCAGAILQARIKRIVYATPEPKFGVIESLMSVFSNKKVFNHHVEYLGGVCQEQSSQLLKDYFRHKRIKKS